jgi:hypothetical protein
MKALGEASAFARLKGEKDAGVKVVEWRSGFPGHKDKKEDVPGRKAGLRKEESALWC